MCLFQVPLEHVSGMWVGHGFRSAAHELPLTRL